jgi:hypothetical protein
MLKVPIHELTHVLIPHNWVDFREGIAVYLADQIIPYTKEDIPSNLDSIINYQGNSEDVKLSYSFAGLKIRFILEECLNDNTEKFLMFISTPDQELNYHQIGYNNEKDFLDAFKEYLLNKAEIAEN